MTTKKSEKRTSKNMVKELAISPFWVDFIRIELTLFSNFFKTPKMLVLPKSCLDFLRIGWKYSTMVVCSMSVTSKEYVGLEEGTKAEDLTQIGKFGIGFKSVYAYTINPEIYSGDESFRIEHYIRPYPAEPKKPEKPYTTLFIFTFNREEVSAETACQEIGSRLLNLNARTLLFLCKIDEIEYKLPDQTGGVYMRETKSRGIARQVTVIGQNNGKEDNQEWLIFARPVQVPDNGDDVKVEIAFQIETNPKNSIETIQETPVRRW